MLSSRVYPLPPFTNIRFPLLCRVGLFLLTDFGPLVVRTGTTRHHDFSFIDLPSP